MVGNRTYWAWLFVTPALLLLLAAAGWPLLRTLYFSLTDYDLGNPDRVQFIGLKNFYYLALDHNWWRAVRTTLLFAFASIGIEVVLGLAIALILNQSFRGRNLVRAMVLVPWAIPTVVSSKIWAWMFNDTFGVINELLIRLHLVEQRISWLGDDTLSMVAVVAVDVWKTTPFVALLLLASLQNIPRSIYEVAKIDGIQPWRRFVSITLPFIRPALFITVIFRTLDALRVFDSIYVLNGNSRATASMAIYAREQLIDFQDFGYGSAVSIAIFLLIALVTAVYFRMTKGAVQ